MQDVLIKGQPFHHLKTLAGPPPYEDTGFFFHHDDRATWVFSMKAPTAKEIAAIESGPLDFRLVVETPALSMIGTSPVRSAERTLLSSPGLQRPIPADTTFNVVLVDARDGTALVTRAVDVGQEFADRVADALNTQARHEVNAVALARAEQVLRSRSIEENKRRAVATCTVPASGTQLFIPPGSGGSATVPRKFDSPPWDAVVGPARPLEIIRAYGARYPDLWKQVDARRRACSRFSSSCWSGARRLVAVSAPSAARVWSKVCRAAQRSRTSREVSYEARNEPYAASRYFARNALDAAVARSARLCSGCRSAGTPAGRRARLARRRGSRRSGSQDVLLDDGLDGRGRETNRGDGLVDAAEHGRRFVADDARPGEALAALGRPEFDDQHAPGKSRAVEERAGDLFERVEHRRQRSTGFGGGGNEWCRWWGRGGVRYGQCLWRLAGPCRGGRTGGGLAARHGAAAVDAPHSFCSTAPTCTPERSLDAPRLAAFIVPVPANGPEAENPRVCAAALEILGADHARVRWLPAALACRWLAEDAFAVVPEGGVATPSWYFAGAFVEGADSAEEHALFRDRGWRIEWTPAGLRLSPLDEPAPRTEPATETVRRIEELGMSSFRDDRW